MYRERTSDVYVDMRVVGLEDIDKEEDITLKSQLL